MDERDCIRIKSESGEKLRKILLDASLLDIDYKIISTEKHLFLPLVDGVDSSLLESLLNGYEFELGRMTFELAFIRPKSLEDALRGTLTESELDYLPRAYDLIGDIVVLEIHPEILNHKEAIGSAFLRLHPNFKTVLAKSSAISGITRVREYELLSGVDKTSTIHTEYGCRLAVDLEKAYFSPRLLEEHNRIANLVHEGETIIDMFTGVGPFALHIARHCKASVTAIDINPEAIELLKKSMSMNKLLGTIIPITADAALYTNANFDRSVDRVIMNHPSGAEEFVFVACKALKPHGVMHYYDFIGGQDPDETVRSKIDTLVREAGFEIEEIVLTRKVRDSAPYEWQMAADVVIR
jgi:tRNA (guanine37-N1)-methyltransferase